jgi:predicted Zn-dependent protease
MIGQLLDAATRRVRNADACVMSDHSLSVTHSPEGAEATHRDSHIAHLRLEDEGRLGAAARDDRDVGAVVHAAMASAKVGREGALLRPLPAPLPTVMTSHPGAASLGVRDLNSIAETLRARVSRAGRVVRTWAERSAARVDVGNTRGVLAGYDATMVGLGLSAASPASSGRLALRLRHVAVGIPDEPVIAGLAREVEDFLAPPLLDAHPLGGAHPVWLTPRALAVVLAPLRQSLLAHGVCSAHGPWMGKVGDRILDDRVTIADDSLAPGRPGSRPIDDEGVVTQRRVLVRSGILVGALADLEAAARFGIPATGSAKRGSGSRTWIGWSNIVLEPGDATEAELLEAAEGGVLIRDLYPGSGNQAHGRVSWSTPWAYKVEKGNVTGRYERYELQGSVFEMLNRVVAVGKEGRWIGANGLPDIVVEVG